MTRSIALLGVCTLLCFPLLVFAQPPPESGSPDSLEAARPVLPGILNARAEDAPNDNGTAILVTWDSPAALAELGVTGIGVSRRGTGETEFVEVATVPRLANDYTDHGLKSGRGYVYQVSLIRGDEIGPPAITAEIAPKVQWFHSAKGFLLMNLLVVSAAILISVLMAARGKIFTIRKIAGIEAVEESVGRATEMGKSVLFVPGIQDMDNVQTVAGLTILGSIAQMTAKYETRLDVPVSKSLVMSTGRETVKEAYTTSGRPDLFHEDVVHYITDEQFGYVAAIDGIMLRDRPATCIYMGAFFAESLILAETGNSIGAIQIAGTAMPTQLPFFVAACDYTLIGEELFAASAYLSKSQSLLGSLRGQDIGKALAMLFIVVGVVAETVGHLSGEGSTFLAISGFLRRFFATNF